MKNSSLDRNDREKKKVTLMSEQKDVSGKKKSGHVIKVYYHKLTNKILSKHQHQLSDLILNAEG